MPTGYTAGILNGKIKTFKQFATQCIRAFGGAVHMRDDDWYAAYRPDKVSDYYSKRVEDINKKINVLNKLSDKELIKNQKNELLNDRMKNIKTIVEKKEVNLKLKMFLDQAHQYEPPTPEHIGIKDFMIQQLTDTIDCDGNISYYEEKIKLIDEKLKNIDPIEIRKTFMDDYLDDLTRAQKYLKEEEERVNNRNEWSRQYLESIK